MTGTEIIKKYYTLHEADYFLFNFNCTLCDRVFEPDTSRVELLNHLKNDHPTVKEFK